MKTVVKQDAVSFVKVVNSRGLRRVEVGRQRGKDAIWAENLRRK